MTNVNQGEARSPSSPVQLVESDARRQPFLARVVLQLSQKISNPKSMNLLAIMNALQQS
jgi:hypothetical protein